MAGRIINDDRGTVPAQVTKLRETAKERRHPPVLILAPRFVWMVVALRAIQTPSEKNTHLFGHGVLHRTYIGARPVVPRGTVESLAGDALSRYFVIGAIALDEVADPFPIQF